MNELVWLIIAVILGIAEAITVGLVCIWFAIGALVAIIPAWLGAPIWVQVLVFIIVSGACLAFTKRFLKDYLKLKKQPTNADSLIGQDGLCTEDINNILSTGKVDISSLTWSARSDNDKPISKGKIVTIKSISGATLIVEEKNESIQEDL